jgi:hypothetical protein
MKKIFIFCFYFSFATILFSQNLDSMLLLYYPFSGNANDISGNNFHGTIYNATLTEDRFGNSNSAYYFNGTNSYIELPNETALKPELPVSFSFWIYLYDINNENSCVLSTDYQENSYTGIRINLNPTTKEISVSYGDGTPNSTTSSSRRTKTGTTIFQNNTWYCVTFVVKDEQDMNIYINGINDNGTYSGSGGPLAYSSNAGTIGKADNYGVPPYYFEGKIDNFRYWNRALTQEDVTLISSSTNINETKDNLSDKLIIYPNPVKDILYIDKKIPTNNIEYKIIDILGKNIDNGIIQNNSKPHINIESLPTGIYLLILNDGAKNYSVRFIKN